MLVMGVVFWTTNTFFIALDLLKPAWAQPYKVQTGSRVSIYQKYCYIQVNLSGFLSTLPLVLFNEFVMSPPIGVVGHWLGKRTGVSFDPHQLPSVLVVVLHIIVCIFVEEILFYYLHR